MTTIYALQDNTSLFLNLLCVVWYTYLRDYKLFFCISFINILQNKNKTILLERYFFKF